MINPKILSRVKNLLIWGIVLLGLSFGASLILLTFEQNAGNTEIDTIPEIYWWWIQTVTGLGAGAQILTQQGRIIASFIVFSGFILLGLFISDFSDIIRMIYARKNEGNIRSRSKNHIVIFGYTSLTAGIIKLLKRHFTEKLKIVLISNDTNNNPFPGEVDFINDNPISRETLEDANIHQATAAIILANDRFRDPDTYSLVIAAGVEKYNTNAITIVELIDTKKRDLFKKIKIDAFIYRNELLNDLLDKNPNPKLKRIIAKESYLDEELNQDIKADLI